MSQSKPAPWHTILHPVWLQLTAPHPSITDPQERRVARTLAALLILTVAILLFGRVFRAVNRVDEAPFNVAAIWVNILVLTVAYGVSRTAHFRLGAYVAVTVVSVIIFLQTLYRGVTMPGDLTNPAAWLVGLLLLSSFVISWRATMALGVAYMSGLIMLPRVLPGVSFLDIRFSVELVFALSFVITLASYLRRRDLQMIQAQTEELTESENRYRILFEAAFEGIVIHDEGTIVDLNDSFLEIFGYSREELIGAPVLTVIPAELHGPVFEKAEANILNYELTGLHKDGTTFPIEISVRRVMYHGRLLRVVAMRNISERKREEAERIQLITERERAQVLRKFISDASHDLRQPLATMMTSLYLLRRKSGDLGPAARHVDTLDAQAAHLARLLDDLFAMSRLDEPDLYMECAPLNLNELVGQIVQEQQSAAAQKGHHLAFEPGSQLPPLMVDHVELRRAILHILVNALSYTREGGHITVRTRLEAGQAIIEVQDTGIGISAHDLPHIFKRFYRADLARQTDTGGSGLGLAIAQKIVETHSGTIQVESNLGEGSTFRVCLPIPQQSRAG